MSPTVIIFFIVSLIILILIIGAPIKLFRFVGQGIVKLLIGAILLFILNFVGNDYGLHIPINFITTFISGILGLPGILSLIAIQVWIL